MDERSTAAKVIRIQELRAAMATVANMLYDDGRKGHEKAGCLLEGIVNLINESLDGPFSQGDIAELGVDGAVISTVERNMGITIKEAK